MSRVVTLHCVAGYDDGRVGCTEDGIVLRNYYGPFVTKRIANQSIAEVREVPNRWKNRSGGSGDRVHRLNWDPHRRRKDRALVIYLKDEAAAKVRVPRSARRVRPDGGWSSPS